MISNKDVDAICSYFVVDQQFFGEQQEIELCEGGKDKLVTDENKHDYVQLVANQRLYKAISTQIDALLKGFYQIVPKDLVKIFDNRELELLISGLQVIDIDDLRESPALNITKNLAAQNKFNVVAVEPNVSESDVKGIPLVALEQALSADVLVLLVDHKQFKQFKPANSFVVDTKGIW